MLQLLLPAGITALIIALVVYQVHKISWLGQHGRRITAMVTSIRHETGQTRLGFTRDNYYLTATWTNPRTGQAHTFWTWIMSTCPPFRIGSLVSVLIDPKHPTRYTLDV